MVEELSQAHVHLPRGDLHYAVEVGLRNLRNRQLVTEEGGQIAINPEEREILAYYAQSIAHLFRNRSA